MGSSTFIATKNVYAFISTGEKNCLFTLRVMQKGQSYYSGIPYDDFNTFHVKNLGINLEESIAKAKQYAEQEKLAFKLSIKDTHQLCDIQRLTPEELSHKKWEEEAERLRKASLKEATALAKHNELSAKEYTLESRVCFGKYSGYTLGQLIEQKADYIKWMFANNTLPFERLSNDFQSQLNWLFKNVDKSEINKQLPVSNWVGEAKGEKLENLVAKCIEVGASKLTVGFNQTVYQALYKLVDESGNQIQITYGGNKWEMEEGKTYKFNGKVKSHKERNGQKFTELTYVNRVAENEQ